MYELFFSILVILNYKQIVGNNINEFQWKYHVKNAIIKIKI